MRAGPTIVRWNEHQASSESSKPSRGVLITSDSISFHPNEREPQLLPKGSILSTESVCFAVKSSVEGEANRETRKRLRDSQRANQVCQKTTLTCSGFKQRALAFSYQPRRPDKRALFSTSAGSES
jgi:hypothetical protein